MSKNARKSTMNLSRAEMNLQQLSTTTEFSTDAPLAGAFTTAARRTPVYNPRHEQQGDTATQGF